MIYYVLFVFFILFSVTGRGIGATAAYKPTEVFLFNCGDTSNNVDNNGRNWTVENPKILSSNLANASFSSDALYQESGVPQVPYMKARIFRSDFTYSFPVSPGWKYLRLYFYPTRYGSDSNAVTSFFSVNVNSYTLLKNFSAELTVKASKPELKYVIKEFIVVPVNQTLNLTFTLSPHSLAFINGVEIVSMPDRLYSKGGFGNMITNVDNIFVDVSIDNLTAFETVHRFNIGGELVEDVYDSGMFRRWLPDVDNHYDGIVVGNFAGMKINYTDKTPAYVAPENVYATSRSMGNAQHPRLNLNFNLTWLFTVDAGFNYLVRLHFCEILPGVNGTNQRVFSIFIDNQRAKLDMDVIQISGGPRIPVYLDFRVYVGSERGPRPDLRLMTLYYDVIASDKNE